MAAVQVQLDGRGEQVWGGVLLPGSRSGGVLLPQGLSSSKEKPVRIDGGKFQQKFLDKVEAWFVTSRQNVGDIGTLDAHYVCELGRLELFELQKLL